MPGRVSDGGQARGRCPQVEVALLTAARSRALGVLTLNPRHSECGGLAHERWCLLGPGPASLPAPAHRSPSLLPVDRG